MLDFAAMILVALGVWNYTPPFQITYTEVQDYVNPDYIAYAEVYDIPPRACNIVFITPRVEAMGRFAQDVVTHEVGHCLGMIEHLDDDKPGLMRSWISITGFTGWDRWLFWQKVKTAPFRTYFPF